MVTQCLFKFPSVAESVIMIIINPMLAMKLLDMSTFFLVAVVLCTTLSFMTVSTQQHQGPPSVEHNLVCPSDSVTVICTANGDNIQWECGSAASRFVDCSTGDSILALNCDGIDFQVSKKCEGEIITSSVTYTASTEEVILTCTSGQNSTTAELKPDVSTIPQLNVGNIDLTDDGSIRLIRIEWNKSLKNEFTSSPYNISVLPATPECSNVCTTMFLYQDLTLSLDISYSITVSVVGCNGSLHSSPLQIKLQEPSSVISCNRSVECDENKICIEWTPLSMLHQSAIGSITTPLYYTLTYVVNNMEVTGTVQTVICNIKCKYMLPSGSSNISIAGVNAVGNGNFTPCVENSSLSNGKENDTNEKVSIIVGGCVAAAVIVSLLIVIIIVIAKCVTIARRNDAGGSGMRRDLKLTSFATKNEESDQRSKTMTSSGAEDRVEVREPFSITDESIDERDRVEARRENRHSYIAEERIDERLQWKSHPKAPTEIITRGSSAVVNNILYITPRKSKKMYAYDFKSENWQKDIDMQAMNTSLVNSNGVLVCVGGQTIPEESATNDVLSFINNEWEKKFPSMKTKRYSAAVLAKDDFMVVAGGKKEKAEWLDIIEVFINGSTEWFTTVSLPKPISSICAAFFDEYVIVTSWNGNVYAYPLEILKSQVNVNDMQDVTSDHAKWIKFTLPVKLTTPVSYRDRLLAIGGLSHNNLDRKDDIYEYTYATNIENGIWKIISRMPTKRYITVASVLNENQLIVIGGSTGLGEFVNVVEIAKYSED